MVDFNLMRQNQHPLKTKKKKNSLVYSVLISSLSFICPMIKVHFFLMTVMYLTVMAMIYIVDNES